MKTTDVQATCSNQRAVYHVEAVSPKKKPLYSFVKRFFDILLSLIAGVVLVIPMVIIALAIRLDSPGPALFKQERLGKGGKPFVMYKFRTMYVNAEEMIKEFTPEQKIEWENNFKLEHDPRITRIGHLLRRTSLDELPQLFNILKGELSIVGPRPVIEEELEKYEENKSKFLSATPGLTGYWQAYARSTCSYDKRMEMELYYVDHANLWWDIKILFKTVGTVLSGRGAR